MTASALADARSRVEASGGSVGEQLVAAGVMSDEALTDFYRSRLLVPQVNPNTLARLPIRVVAAIPSDMAIELRAVPVALDADNNLTVAMGDPSDSNAVDEITWFTGAYVVRAVATQMQIAWCLAHYYGHVTTLGQRLMQQTTGAQQPVSPPVSRTKGLTGKVEAMRHKRVHPLDGPVNLARPQSGEIALPPESPTLPPVNNTTTTLAPDMPRLAPDSPTLPPMSAADAVTPKIEPESSDGIPDRPRARTASGEIRVPGRRAPSIRPPMPEPLEDDESGPVMTIEVSDQDDEVATGPLQKPAPAPTPAAPQRKRKAKTDPPELAARAGEVDIATGPVRKVDLEEPRIIIAEEVVHPTGLPTATSGELRVIRARPEPSSGVPSSTIEVSEDTSAAVVIHERPPEDTGSQPILLERRRPSDQPTTITAKRAPEIVDDQDDDDEVLELHPKKAPAPPRHSPNPSAITTAARPPVGRSAVRAERRTQVGIGALPAQTRTHRDTETTGVPNVLEDAPTGQMLGDDTVLTHAAPRGDDSSYDTSDETLAAPPSPDDTKSMLAAPPRPGSGRARTDERDDDDDGLDADTGEIDIAAVAVASRPTRVMSAAELDAAVPHRSSGSVPPHLSRKTPPKPMEVEADPLDDGWGPPGTTIPPPLLGAVPGARDDEGGRIPVSNIDSAPLIVAPAVPPDAARTGQTPQRALETATSRLIELIRQLEHTRDRDEVVSAMIAHLAESHRRAGFFAVKRDELSVFSIEPRPAAMPFASLRLDRASTLHDVVNTRLPYRGPISDEISRQFLTAALGLTPPEILLVPVTVRERVVGVLFGDGRTQHTFDDQLAFASRAAGMALERILKAKRG